LVEVRVMQFITSTSNQMTLKSLLRKELEEIMSEGQGSVGVGDHVCTPTKERRDSLSLKVVPHMHQK